MWAVALLFVKKSQEKNEDNFLNFSCYSFKSKIPVGIKAGSSNKVSHFSSLNIFALHCETYISCLTVVAEENCSRISWQWEHFAP